jgi:hypothetical protein
MMERVYAIKKTVRKDNPSLDLDYIPVVLFPQKAKLEIEGVTINSFSRKYISTFNLETFANQIVSLPINTRLNFTIISILRDIALR